MVLHVQSNHEKMGKLRRKFSRPECEECSARAAAVFALAKELQMVVPVSEAIIKEHWLNKFADGDSTVFIRVHHLPHDPPSHPTTLVKA